MYVYKINLSQKSNFNKKLFGHHSIVMKNLNIEAHQAP